MQHPITQSLQAAFEATATAQGGTLGLDDIIGIIIRDSKTWGREKLDTEEKRDLVIQYVLDLADQFAAPRFPFVWGLVRDSIEAFLDKAIDNVPVLLAAAQARDTDPNTSVA